MSFNKTISLAYPDPSVGSPYSQADRFGVICTFTESALNPLVQIINKDIKQGSPNTDPLVNTTLVTGRYLDLTLFTITLQAWPSSQFFT